MEQLIDKASVVSEIRRIIKNAEAYLNHHDDDNKLAHSFRQEKLILCELLSYIDALEVKEVDLGKLGEIARHLIAVKEHIEDMRLDKEEWFMLERIGYPEKLKTQKGK